MFMDFILRTIALERAVADAVGDADQHIAADNHGQEGLPCHLDPVSIVDTDQGAANQCAARPQQVGQAVAQLIGQNHNLLIDPQHFSQRAHDWHHHDGFTGPGDNQEVECGYKQVDQKKGDQCALSVESISHVVNQRVHNLSLLQQNHNGLCHADGQGSNQNLGSTFAVNLAVLVRGDTVNHCKDNRIADIVCSKLTQSEAQLQATVGGPENQHQEQEQADGFSPGEWQAAFGIGVGSGMFCQGLLIFFGHIALIRVFFDAVCITDDADQSDNKENGKHNETISDTGEHRKTDDLLGNTGGEHIDGTTGKSGGGRIHHDAGCGQAVIAHGHHQSGDDREERISAFAQTEYIHTCEIDVENDQCNHAFSVGNLVQFLYTGFQRPGMIQNAQCTGAQKQGAHDGGSAYETCVNGTEEVLKSDWICLFRKLEIIRIDCTGLCYFEGTAGNEFGHQRNQNHNTK